MKRSKAFILAEILTGTMLQAGFLLVLCGTFYMIVSFYSRAESTLAVRGNGERVISYIESRIKNAGVGLWACGSPKGIAKALEDVTVLNNLVLPVAVTSGDFYTRYKEGNVYKGNKLTVLYARRELATDRKLILLTTNNQSVDIAQGETGRGGFRLIDTGEKELKDYAGSDFGDASNKKNLLNFAVMQCTGKPVRLQYDSNSAYVAQSHLMVISPYTNATAYPLDELMYLNCERMFVHNDNARHERNFAYSAITGYDSNKMDDARFFGPEYNHEKIILEIYMELDTNTKIFKLYVLSGSDYNASLKTPKPDIWPAAFWKPEFAHHIVHVSLASWKLHNLEPLDYNDVP